MPGATTVARVSFGVLLGSVRRRLQSSTGITLDTIKLSLLAALVGVSANDMVVTWKGPYEATCVITMSNSTTITEQDIATSAAAPAFVTSMSASLGVSVVLTTVPAITSAVLIAPSPPPPVGACATWCNHYTVRICICLLL
jgi:hypothetical protein